MEIIEIPLICWNIINWFLSRRYHTNYHDQGQKGMSQCDFLLKLAILHNYLPLSILELVSDGFLTSFQYLLLPCRLKTFICLRWFFNFFSMVVSTLFLLWSIENSVIVFKFQQVFSGWKISRQPNTSKKPAKETLKNIYEICSKLTMKLKMLFWCFYYYYYYYY